MSFDKVKAMRNAERFLAQGKIRAAINEYKRVVENDAKDFSTLNMLGDLYAKASENEEAVRCFTLVAEHYSKQGFAQKAIAIYNKISRLVPDSLDVSAKLAQLYQMKGSVAEARSHYTVIAEQYSRTGRKAEALSAWTQIAKLDPNNTDICLKIADAYWQEEQKDEAAEAYIEAGKRLSAKNQFDSAVTVFARALELKPNDLIAVKGFVSAQTHLGTASEAIGKLREILQTQPNNREITYLLIDCYLDMDNTIEAENTLIKLVEHEPSNYPKCLDIVQVYLKVGDLTSATRMLNIASEHLLVGAQAEELEKWVNEILAKNPEQVDALRLLVRYHSWQRDESELKFALERLAEAARHDAAFIEDERYALSQLVLLVPQSVEFAGRLQEINERFGPSEVSYENPLLSKNETNEVPTYESYARFNDDYENDSQSGDNLTGYEDFSGELNYSGIKKTPSGFRFEDGAEEAFDVERNDQFVTVDLEVTADAPPARGLSESEKYHLQQELEGVDFYVQQGYTDLAEKTLLDIESRFGKHDEIEKVRAQLKPNSSVAVTQEIVVEQVEFQESSFGEQFNPMDEFKSDLGFEETETEEEGDYDTHYHLGIAYKEMGLTEDSIREFQDAVKYVSAGDGTRRFFLCCNLLGHCFMEKQMPNLALMWFRRAMETKNLNEEEVQGLRYELANALEMGGDKDQAIEYFEKVYADNVDYRDVSERLQRLQAH